MTVKLKLTPQRNALLKGFDNEFYALLQLIDEKGLILIYIYIHASKYR